ncbi:MAG: hypothetical protein ACYDIB_03505 [Desulfobulbia bacterium]
MNSLLAFVSNNGLLSTLIGAAIIWAIGWLARCRQNKKDSEAILILLKKSADETQYTFRSTEAIASETKLTEARVEELCAKHPKIQRNAKEKQSWKLAE